MTKEFRFVGKLELGVTLGVWFWYTWEIWALEGSPLGEGGIWGVDTLCLVQWVNLFW